MTFAGALQITDLDDFLTPSQACIIPVRGSKPATDGDGNTEIVIDGNNNYYEVSTYPTSGSVEVAGRQALKKAEISLNDCLACSGCITSTESLLITMQSHNEVLAYIQEGKFERTPILSIAPQTLASLSASYAAAHSTRPIPLLVLLRRIRAFLSAPERGAWRVWDTTFARHISLLETVREFAARQKAQTLPVLASACPGWVCYAEKAQGELLPLLSAARSAQGVAGALAKIWFAAANNTTPDKIYHVTAMPCYDKKLEASRADFFSEVYKTKDTDCVLTTGELDLLLAELGFDPMAPVEGEALPPLAPTTVDPESRTPFPELLQHPGSSSGSYVGALLSALAAAHPGARLSTRRVRGSTDNVEYTLEADDKVLFKGATVYGFRNLQNMVRRVGKESGRGRAGPRGAGAGKLQAAVAARRRKRTAATEIATPSTPGTPGTPSEAVDLVSAALAAAREEKKLDFIEVMACPGGCVNGGGQMKPAKDAKDAKDAEGYPRPMADDGVASQLTSSGLGEDMRWSTKEWVASVEDVYWTGLPTPPPSPVGEGARTEGETLPAWPERTRAADPVAHQVVETLLAADKGATSASFAKVESDVLSQGGLTHEQAMW